MFNECVCCKYLTVCRSFIPIYHDLLTSSGGNHLLEIVIDNGTQTIVRDTTFYFSNPTISIIDPPQGLKDGINYINDSTVTLLLNAPNKSFVYVLGDLIPSAG